MRRITLPALLALAFSSIACATEPPTTPTFTTRDSAGVVIAEIHGTLEADTLGWPVSAEPTLEIGALQGEEAYLFQRIAGAVTLSDGSVAVLDSRSPDLRIFSSTGEHLRTFGTLGEGPGEFRSPRHLGRLPGDTLVVVDVRLRRINLFHPVEGFIRNATATTDIPGYLLTEGMFSSGSILVQRLVFGEDVTDGYTRRPVHYRSVALDGRLETDFGEFPGEEMVLATDTQGQATMSLSGDAPFGRSAVVAVGGNRFFYSSQDSYEIQVFRQSGSLERIIRWTREGIPVTPDQVDAALEEALSDLDEVGNDNLAREYRRHFESAPIPDTHPAHGALYLDTESLLWVEETRVSDEDPSRFVIFDAEGRPTGSATLPRGLLPLEIGQDYILGRVVDDMGVQYLGRYSLVRPDGRNQMGG